MSMLRRRLLIMMATSNGIPNSPIRFSNGAVARFSDGKRGYFALDYRFVKDKSGSRMYFKDGKKVCTLRK
ncbi:hypothetical protein H6A66_10880 [Bacteroides caecigallinarum]|uniref:hypothetical protein n=1 Tax=Bacteroides caecigallinarum TaxID=1411144 RepID=UPI001957B105|nr:hypothetical protein [Bacteroides caecigallinarum]MBM6865666.1 hypothetical protein [Bacteroides caecigallinarum]